MELEWFRPNPDPIFQVVPDPDHALYTRPTYTVPGTGNWKILSVPVHNGTAARLFKHLQYFLGKYVHKV